MKSLSSLIATTGVVYLSSTIILAITQAPLGSPLFFGLAAVATLAYLVMLRRVWREPHAPLRALLAAFVLAVAFRVPLTIRRVDAASDMVRYQWDGRVQRLGYNPYLVVPANPAMAPTHTEDTRQMPSLRVRTPYPPGAQLFFRLVVSIRDSSRAMKLALLACDLLTIVLLWRWLVMTGRNEWLTLAYAWNPLVVLEVAHSGHIDALGALWILASACWLTRGRTLLASIAFVMAVATKPLPIVLAPLFWGRVRARDILASLVLLGLLLLPFMSGGVLPLGGVSNVVEHVRFNGPVFRLLAGLMAPQGAAITAVAAGLAVAVWARWRRDAADPAAWAWPMATALVCAPVIYPWYLLYFTPFLFTAATLPLVAWTLSIIPTYIVWQIAGNGGRWAVPASVLTIEYAALLVTAITLWVRHGRGPAAAPTTSVPPASPPTG
jgi:alpha-1,6-mannosyltransferase